MDAEQYLNMCEQMGWEPKEEELPKDPAYLSYNIQCALVLYNALPDKWEGMSGSWMGKDYSGLMDIMNIYRMDNKREVFDLLKIAEGEAGKFYAEKAKQQESLSKAKRGR
jgi:hypothetical protein